jgi:hypothetical protein
MNIRPIRLMVSVADKPIDAVLLWEKNTVSWLISQADKFKRTEGLFREPNNFWKVSKKKDVHLQEV